MLKATQILYGISGIIGLIIVLMSVSNKPGYRLTNISEGQTILTADTVGSYHTLDDCIAATERIQKEPGLIKISSCQKPISD